MSGADLFLASDPPPPPPHPLTWGGAFFATKQWSGPELQSAGAYLMPGCRRGAMGGQRRSPQVRHGAAQQRPRGHGSARSAPRRRLAGVAGAVQRLPCCAEDCPPRPNGGVRFGRCGLRAGPVRNSCRGRHPLGRRLPTSQPSPPGSLCEGGKKLASVEPDGWGQPTAVWGVTHGGWGVTDGGWGRREFAGSQSGPGGGPSCERPQGPPSFTPVCSAANPLSPTPEQAPAMEKSAHSPSMPSNGVRQ